ncbi:hypothetical protein KSP40_PGU021602 [Platanthera guangdongensis]|uniref:Acid phosphatase/vanadium-dependent haloperoxidase-related protein n=1 Tax=Platanthera guangdongensis TaxID=2320717 RepID=A0ABR2LXS1_9ASPA
MTDITKRFEFIRVYRYREKRWDPKQLIGSGGMPSSHSATVTSLAAAIGFEDGFGSSLFAASMIFASIARRGSCLGARGWPVVPGWRRTESHGCRGGAGRCRRGHQQQRCRSVRVWLEEPCGRLTKPKRQTTNAKSRARCGKSETVR